MHERLRSVGRQNGRMTGFAGGLWLRQPSADWSIGNTLLRGAFRLSYKHRTWGVGEANCTSPHRLRMPRASKSSCQVLLNRSMLGWAHSLVFISYTKLFLFMPSLSLPYGRVVKRFLFAELMGPQKSLFSSRMHPVPVPLPFRREGSCSAAGSESTSIQFLKVGEIVVGTYLIL